MGTNHLHLGKGSFGIDIQINVRLQKLMLRMKIGRDLNVLATSVHSFILILFILIRVWCCCVMVKHPDSYRRGCELESSMCHNKNAIGKEGNGKPPHKNPIP